MSNWFAKMASKQAASFANGSRARYLIITGYVVTLLFAAYIRTILISGFPQRLIVNLPDTDAARYYRLIELMVKDYPRLVMFDSFANYPWGMKEQLPPLWAFIEASFSLALVRLTGLSVIASASIFPVVVGLILALPSYYVGKQLFGSPTGHMAAVTALISPTAVAMTSAGMLDHHSADLLIYMTIFALVLLSHGLYQRDRRRLAVTLNILAGICVALMLLVSLSSIMVVVILEIAFICTILFSVDIEKIIVVKMGFLLMMTAGASMLALSIITPWFLHGLSFSELSLLQPFLLIGAAIVLAGTTVAVLQYKKPGEKTKVITWSSLTMITMVIVIKYFGVGSLLIKGFYRSLGLYPLGRMTVQLQPVFKAGAEDSHVILSGMTFLAPLVLLYVIKPAFINRRIDFNQTIYIVWFVIAGVYMIAAKYYFLLFLPISIVSVALLISKPAQVIRILTESSKTRDSGLSVILSKIVSGVILGSLLFYWATPRALPETKPDKVEMHEWIKDNTPSVTGYLNPVERPAYGILTHWSTSEQVQIMTHRPVMSSGNHESGIQGIITSQRILQMQSEPEAVSTLRNTGIRYILLDQESPISKGYGLWRGDINRIGESGPSALVKVKPIPVGDIPEEEYARLLSVRLLRGLGAGDAGLGVSPLKHFRLVHALGPNKNNRIVLFEVVDGARLSVNTKPDVEIKVSTEVRVDGLNKLIWKTTGRSDSYGKADFVLPYADKGCSYPAQASPYQISAGDKVDVLSVDEEAVSGGEKVELTIR